MSRVAISRGFYCRHTFDKLQSRRGSRDLKLYRLGWSVGTRVNAVRAMSRMQLGSAMIVHMTCTMGGMMIVSNGTDQV